MSLFLFFTVLSVLAIGSGIVTITNRNPVVSAMSLIFHFFMLAGLYLTLNAQFIAVIQILVYAGAIMVLVVFVIMLLNLGDEESLKDRFNLKKFIAVMFGIAFILQLLSIYFVNPFSNETLSANSKEIGTAHYIGEALFTNYLYPFEAIGILLLAAIVGAMIMAKRKIQE